MSDYPNPSGKTTIDPEVLLTISRLTALSVDGVSRMASGPHNVDSLLRRSYANGVKIEVENNTVYVDIYVVIKRDINLLETSKPYVAPQSKLPGWLYKIQNDSRFDSLR